MCRQSVVVLSALLLAGCGLLSAGEPRQERAGWGELGPRLTDRKVALVLPGGTHVEGKVRAVEPDGLRLNVTRTSDRRALAKGERLIPRRDVSLLRVTEYRKMGRLLAVTGALAVAGGIVAASYPDIYEGAALIAVPAVTAGGMAGIGAGAYYAGKALDKRVTEIRITRQP